MKFTPKTDEQLSSENLLPEGIYPFEVAEASNQTSKAGNPMIKLKLLVYHEDSPRVIFDYIMEKMPFKLKHFCKVTDQLQRYNAGTLEAHDCAGKTGSVKIAIEEATGYPSKNVVQDYVLNQDQIDKVNGQTKMFDDEQKRPSQPVAELEDKDIPF
jgi:hypothetical protein